MSQKSRILDFGELHCHHGGSVELFSSKGLHRLALDMLIYIFSFKFINQNVNLN